MNKEQSDSRSALEYGKKVTTLSFSGYRAVTFYL